VEPAKVKKIEEYVVWLTKQAEVEVGKGNDNEAVQHYVKAADILLALASKTADQTVWEKYTKGAEGLQAKAKLIVSAGQKSGKFPVIDKTPNPPLALNRAEEPKLTSQAEAKTGRMSRIFGALGGNNSKPKASEEPQDTESLPPEPITDSQPPPKVTEVKVQQSVPEPVAPASLPSEPLNNGPQQESETTNPKKLSSPKESKKIEKKLEASIPYQQYLSLLAENEKLKDRIRSMIPRADYESLETRNKELNETLGLMVPRDDYERLQERLTEMVPKSMYLDLQRSLTAMVPKEMYIDAEARASNLKAQLDTSVPSRILDDLASRITILGAAASVPGEGEKMEELPRINYKKWNIDLGDEFPEK
jgi:hypothetical protein